MIIEDIENLNSLLERMNTKEIIRWAVENFGNKLTIASSLGPQSIIITEVVKEITSDPDVFFIDTGLLPKETLELKQECEKFFDIIYRTLQPSQNNIQEYISVHGKYGFQNNVEQRKLCCKIRKVNPLGRALDGYDAWISGVRSEQSDYRSNANFIEWDERFDLIKINPLLDWTKEEVWEYINHRKLPYNKLFDRGYTSIGCDPCTRAIQPGEHDRAGRWWWEINSDAECGVNVITEEDNHPLEMVENYLQLDTKE